MSDLKKIAIKRLKERGVEPDVIPALMRSVATICQSNPDMNLEVINMRLQYLGWRNFELDYHTMQLAISCFEDRSVKKEHLRSGGWFKSRLFT